MSEPDAERLRDACRATKLVEHVHVLNVVRSTQDESHALAQEHGSNLVIAQHQTEGRGRLGRAWHETAGLGLACTFALPATRIDKEEISGRVAVACALALEQAGMSKAWIKWPNDILDDHRRKIAGILIEIRDSWALIGVGVNVHHSPECFPTEIRDTGVSLSMLGVESQPLELALGMIDAIAASLDAAPEETLAAWHARDALIGHEHTFSHAGRTVTGIIESIDPFHGIAIRTSQCLESLDPRIASMQ